MYIVTLFILPAVHIVLNVLIMITECKGSTEDLSS